MASRARALAGPSTQCSVSAFSTQGSIPQHLLPSGRPFIEVQECHKRTPRMQFNAQPRTRRKSFFFFFLGGGVCFVGVEWGKSANKS